MRIGVDACSWSNGRGYGRFTRELLRAMVVAAPADHFVCFVDRSTEQSFDLLRPNVSTVCVEQTLSPTKAASADGYRSPSDMLKLTWATWREEIDVFFSPSVYTYFPLPPKLPAVVTIHDAITEKYPNLTLPTLRAKIFWNLKVRIALWQARIILTVSEYTARDLASILNVPATRIRVTSEAPSSNFRPSETAEQIQGAAKRVDIPPGASWIIYVGGFNPHKNVDAIVRAHATVAMEQRTHPLYLILVGDPERDVFHQDLEKIRTEIARGGTERLVKWAGFVPDEELRHLHSGAIALLLPSECEGFGLPAVEAAACGTPIIATTESPLPDLLEGGGIFVRPGDDTAIVNALRTLLADASMRTMMGTIARQKVTTLSWEKSAVVALNTLQEAIA